MALTYDYGGEMETATYGRRAVEIFRNYPKASERLAYMLSM
jgi:hypothetical protein